MSDSDEPVNTTISDSSSDKNDDDHQGGGNNDDDSDGEKLLTKDGDHDSNTDGKVSSSPSSESSSSRNNDRNEKKENNPDDNNISPKPNITSTRRRRVIDPRKLHDRFLLFDTDTYEYYNKDDMTECCYLVVKTTYPTNPDLSESEFILHSQVEHTNTTIETYNDAVKIAKIIRDRCPSFDHRRRHRRTKTKTGGGGGRRSITTLLTSIKETKNSALSKMKRRLNLTKKTKALPPYDSATFGNDDSTNGNYDYEVLIEVMKVDEYMNRRMYQEDFIQQAGDIERFHKIVELKMTQLQHRRFRPAYYSTCTDSNHKHHYHDQPADLEVNEDTMLITNTKTNTTSSLMVPWMASLESLDTIKSLKYEPATKSIMFMDTSNTGTTSPDSVGSDSPTNGIIHHNDEYDHPESCALFQVLSRCANLEELHLHMKHTHYARRLPFNFFTMLTRLAPGLRVSLKLLSIQNATLSPYQIETLAEFKSLEYLDIMDCLDDTLIMDYPYHANDEQCRVDFLNKYNGTKDADGSDNNQTNPLGFVSPSYDKTRNVTDNTKVTADSGVKKTNVNGNYNNTSFDRRDDINDICNDRINDQRTTKASSKKQAPIDLPYDVSMLVIINNVTSLRQIDLGYGTPIGKYRLTTFLFHKDILRLLDGWLKVSQNGKGITLTTCREPIDDWAYDEEEDDDEDEDEDDSSAVLEEARKKVLIELATCPRYATFDPQVSTLAKNELERILKEKELYDSDGNDDDGGGEEEKQSGCNKVNTMIGFQQKFDIGEFC